VGHSQHHRPLGVSNLGFPTPRFRLSPLRSSILGQSIPYWTPSFRLWGLTALRRSKPVEPGSDNQPPSRAPSETKMSFSFPQEITDLIIDHLHNEPTTLRTCCLVSKSWIPRARKYLFVHIKFYPSMGRLVSRWRKTFPDPTDSPAHHTRTLSICNPLLITTADVDTIRTFCGVVCLNMDTDLMQDQAVSLVPFHGLSPVMRSLRLTFATLPYSKIFNLILSFPLLEDLVLVSRSRRREDREWSTPSTSSRLTGSLELRLAEGIQPITYRLLDLPNGIHFTKLVVSWISGEDVGSTTDLVSRCSGTLESLDVASYLCELPSSPMPD